MAVSTLEKNVYHRGNLRAELLQAATEILETGEPFSLRAVARRAGVSPAAPYRHFADREALESAVAVEGFKDLYQQLVALADATDDDVAKLAEAYVFFALEHPTVFRLMFGQECDDSNDDRVQASRSLQDFLTAAVQRQFPAVDASTLAVSLWSLAHGLAFLHLDGKFSPQPSSAVASRVRASFAAVLNSPGN